MSASNHSRTLVLGGIRSGKSEFAESLVATRQPPDGRTGVRYLATAMRIPGDADWDARIEAHQRRRPPEWTTVEATGDPPDPAVLPALITDATPDDRLLVDDVGTWVAMAMQHPGWTPDEIATQLARAVSSCSAPLVLVSPEVGLSVVPVTSAGRFFADALGTTNRALAATCDAVHLVIAGCAVRVKGGL